MKPVILISHKFENDPIPFGVGRILCIRSNYCRSIERAGGVPLITAGGDPEAYAALADGILFTGSGSDISPALYGQENRGSLGCDSELDEMEMKLFEAFYKAGKPILGVCRVHQLINVALGGTLYQDAPTQHPGIGVHRNDDETVNTFHSVTTLPGSVMASLFGPELLTNSYHHQAIQTLAPGLIATAKTSDGIIEAIQHESRPILAVQFHPERMIGDEQTNCPGMLPLFRHFIELCAK